MDKTDNADLNLNKYFGKSAADSAIDLHLNLENKTQDVNEPAVCKLFSDPSPQTNDPTAAFFDLLGNGYSTQSFGAADLTTSMEEYGSHLLSCTEAERRRDAWIPTDKCRQSLITIAMSPPGTYFPERDLLTMPGILLNEDLGDCIADAVSISFGETVQRRSYKSTDVTQDERGLRELIKVGAYSAAINLTTNLLAIYGQGKGRANHPSKHSPHSLQLWFTRIALLVKMKMYSMAHLEAEAFGQLDKPDLFYQFYPDMYQGRPGSMATFSFRLLLAELPMHYQKPDEALSKLFGVFAVIKQILKNLGNGLCEDGNPAELRETDVEDSIRLWTGRETRTMHSIINCCLMMRNYELAVELLEELVARTTQDKNLAHQDKASNLLSALGRLRLQFGDIAGAELCFKQCKERQLPNASDSDVAIAIRDHIDRGLLAVAQNAFADALTCFHQAHALDSNNVMVVNNIGVCLLYSGKLKEAIAMFESAILNNPTEGLQESLLMNLCTLYDMESANSKAKKLGLLKQIAQYWVDAPSGVLERFYN